MSIDQWYFLKCSSCRASMRIKTAYVHMRGYCPQCNQRIEPPVPKPLVISDMDEPGGLMPQDENWPEPATLLDTNNNTETGSVTGYSFNESTESIVAKPKPQEEEEEGGVYSLAFDPDMPKGPGISRSAEWDQGNASPTALPVVDPKSSKSMEERVVPHTEVKSLALQPEPEVVYRTEIDPLFGDVIKVPVSSLPEKTTEPKKEPSLTVAPVARLASPEDIKPASDLDDEESSVDSWTPVLKKKKKKKKKAKPAESESQSLASLDTPTDQVHLYRLSEAEENRIKLDAPPKSLFFDGVMGFPFETRNLGPWIILSIGFSINTLIGWLTNYILQNGGMFAAVGAGAMGMAFLFVNLFTLAYACGCMSNCIVFTSAGSRAVEWATEGWKENVVTMLRIGYYYVLAMMMSAPMLVLNFVESMGTILWIAVTLFLFPVFLFSGMASLTFWNFLHADVIKKIMAKGHSYLFMYGLSIVILFMAGVANYFSVRHLWLVLISGPISAAAWLIYSRLLGRMAWLLQQEPKRKKKKKKKKINDLEETDLSEEGEAVLAGANEKGPREDARGPGGARPV